MQERPILQVGQWVSFPDSEDVMLFDLMRLFAVSPGAGEHFDPYYRAARSIYGGNVEFTFEVGSA